MNMRVEAERARRLTFPSCSLLFRGCRFLLHCLLNFLVLFTLLLEIRQNLDEHKLIRTNKLG